MPRNPREMTHAPGRLSVFVSGGSRGIGAAIVRTLAESGANVFFTYANARESAELLAASLDSDRVAFTRCEMSNSDDLERAMKNCTDRYKRLDVLVNNAAVYAENPFDGDDYAAWRAGWRATFDVNVFGTADLTWLALRAMRANAPNDYGVRGRVVNITSRAAHRGETTFADYGASKAALGNFTRSIARGCASDGIVAFNVAPGFIATDMAREAIERDGERIASEIPSGRIGTPAEIASIVAMLASGAADYATGTTIDVNGASYVR